MNKKLIVSIILFLLTFVSVVEIEAQVKTIVAFGDSITAKRKGLIVYADLIKEAFDRKGVPINIVNAGVPGNTTENAKIRFEKDVLNHKPDLTIIQFGTNDSAYDVWKNPPATEPRVAINVYEKNIRDFVKTLKKHNSKVILVIPPPLRWTQKMIEMYGKSPFDPDKKDGFNVSLRNYNQVLKKIARAEKVVLVDLFEAYQKYDNIEGQSMDNLLLDGIHPNSDGQKIEAELLIEVFKKMNFGL